MPGCGSKRERTPVKYLKREDISLEGEAARKHAGDLKKFSHPQEEQEFSGSPHSEPAAVDQPHYKDHGAGNHFGERKLPHDEKDISKKVFKNGPRHTSESTDMED